MAIELDDLIKKCETCGGAGTKETAIRAQQGNTFGYTPIPNSRSNTCDACDGVG